MTKDYEALRERLEQLVDSFSILDVVSALSYVCYEKAEHLRSNWQDSRTGDAWGQVGSALDKVEALPVVVALG